jgi:hypothetical protein
MDGMDDLVISTSKLILGLIRPTGGSCTAFGMDTIGNSIRIRHRIGYLAQDPRYYESLKKGGGATGCSGYYFSRDEFNFRQHDTLLVLSWDALG